MVSLSRKIIGTFVVVSLLVGLTSGLSYYFLQRIDSSYSTLLQDHSAILQHASDIQYYTQLQNSLLFSHLVEPSKDKEEQLKAANTTLSSIIQKMTTLTQNEDELKEIQSLGESNETFARLLTKVSDYINQDKLDLAKSEAKMWAVPLTETLAQTATKIQTSEKKLMEQKAADNQELVSATFLMLVLVSVFAFVFALAIGILLSRMIVRPMRAMVSAAKRIASCDLTVEDITVKNRDEIRDLANAFNQMKENLHVMISQVGANTAQVAATSEALSESSGRVSQSSTQIHKIIQDISVGTESQVSSVHQGVSIIEEMSASVYQIADVTQSVNLKSAHALDAATAGNDAIETATKQMNSIDLKMKELSLSVQRLGSRSSQIVTAVDVITSIAKQTNLLALNASIEAARAGDSGKGFAVVAEEVRKLSQLTSNAAQEVSHLIESILTETSEVASSSAEGIKEVNTGKNVVNQAGEAFQRIQSAVNEVALQINQVTEQSRQIAHKSKVAVEAIRSIDIVAQQAASASSHITTNVEDQNNSIDQIVQSATNLRSMAEGLQNLLKRFTV